MASEPQGPIKCFPASFDPMLSNTRHPASILARSPAEISKNSSRGGAAADFSRVASAGSVTAGSDIVLKIQLAANHSNE